MSPPVKKDEVIVDVDSQQGGGGMMRKLNWRMTQPKEFDGVGKQGRDLGTEASSWLKKMNRFKVTAKLSDEEALFIVGEHLVRKAETWFNIVGSKASSWNEFTEKFKQQYMADMEERWWQVLQTMKQQEGDSIDDMALKMEELFELVNNKSPVFQIQTFLAAIDGKVAVEVEKEGYPVSFEEAKTRAKRIEKSFIKYGRMASPAPVVTGNNKVVTIGSSYETENFYDKKSSSSDAESVSSFGTDVSLLAARLEQLEINIVKIGEHITNQKHAMPVKPYVPRGLTCYHCGAEGHRKYDCKIFLDQQNQTNNVKGPVTGSNAIPIGNSNNVSGASNNSSGKGMGISKWDYWFSI